MPKFCANLTMLFNEVEMLQRFEAAAKAGFSGVEYLFPYDYPKEALIAELRRCNLEQVLINMPAGDWGAGERGIACHPNRRGEFKESVAEAVEFAQALGCSRVNCLAGIAPSGFEPDELRTTLIENLGFAAEKLSGSNIKLLIEPINIIDIPGFYLKRSDQAIGIMDEVNSDNLFLQYDVYHMQIMEGDLARTIGGLLARIGHMQIADNPGRHEPGTGEINYPFLFGLLDRLGYDGWVGCEYKPEGSTEAGLAWVESYLQN